MKDFLPDVDRCLEVLTNGGIILYPTDTVWGLGCDATNAEAVDRIYRLKQRPPNKSMVLLVADERDILRHIARLDLRVFDYLKTVNKPTTIIYQGAIGIAENITGDDGTVAIRMVNEPFCKHLIKRFRKPVVSTSANISGASAPGRFGEIAAAIKNGVDYIVQYRQQETESSVPSSVVRWNDDGTVTVVRA